MTDLDDLEYTPRKPWWILAVVAVVVIVGAGGLAAAFVLQGPTARPARVLVAVELQLQDGTRVGWWQGGEGAANVSADLQDRYFEDLEKLGFDVVSRATEGLGAELDAARSDAARAQVALAHEAAWYVPVVLEVQSITPIGASGAHVEVVAQPRLRVIPTLGGDGPVDVPEPLRLRAVGRNELAAVRRMEGDLVSWSAPPLIATLVAQPGLARLRDNDGLELEDAAAASALKPAFDHLKYREAALANLEERASLAAEVEAASGLPADARISPWHGWTAPLGFGPDGTVVVKDAQLRIDVPLGSHKLEVEEVHETVVKLAPDGSARERLLDEYNFYSHPHVSRDGSTLVAIAEQRSMAMAVVLVDLATGDVQRPYLSEESDLSGPKLSHDGGRLFFWSKPCRDCPPVGQVLDRGATEPVEVVHIDGRTLTWPAWSPDAGTLYFGATDPDGRPSVLAVSVPGGEESTVVDGRGLSTIRDVWTLPDGDLVVSARTADYESQLLRVDLQTGEREVVHQGPHDSVVVAPDGSHLAAELRGLNGWDIHVIDLADGTVTQVTRGDMNEQVVSFTADGQQVIFYVEHYEKESKGRYLTAYVVGIGG